MQPVGLLPMDMDFLVVVTFVAETEKESKCIVCASHFPSLAKSKSSMDPCCALNQATCTHHTHKPYPSDSLFWDVVAQ